jgi:hypothetical protein
VQVQVAHAHRGSNVAASTGAISDCDNDRTTDECQYEKDSGRARWAYPKHKRKTHLATLDDTRAIILWVNLEWSRIAVGRLLKKNPRTKGAVGNQFPSN